MSERRRVDWIASAKKEFDEFPADVKYVMGFALGLIQDGEMPDGVVPLTGIDPPVFEIRERYQGDAYRCLLTARLRHRIYVLHAFKKKSTRGKKTPLPDIELIRRRLAAAIEDDTRYAREEAEAGGRADAEGADNGG